MKEYLKMSDFVVGNVSMSMNHNGDVSVQYDYADPDMVVRKTMDAMEHGINSHDELVTEVERLHQALIDAATSLETIHVRSYGKDSFLDSKHEMRSYAGSRAKVARQALST